MVDYRSDEVRGYTECTLDKGVICTLCGFEHYRKLNVPKSLLKHTVDVKRHIDFQLFDFCMRHY